MLNTFNPTKTNLLKLVQSANNTTSDSLFIEVEECDNCEPYHPIGICAPMQPIGSCLKCGKTNSVYQTKE